MFEDLVLCLRSFPHLAYLVLPDKPLICFDSFVTVNVRYIVYL